MAARQSTPRKPARTVTAKKAAAKQTTAKKAASKKTASKKSPPKKYGTRADLAHPPMASSRSSLRTCVRSSRRCEHW